MIARCPLSTSPRCELSSVLCGLRDRVGRARVSRPPPADTSRESRDRSFLIPPLVLATHRRLRAQAARRLK